MQELHRQRHPSAQYGVTPAAAYESRDAPPAHRFPLRPYRRTTPYTGRDNKTSHRRRGIGVSESDWARFTRPQRKALAHFNVPVAPKPGVCAFIESTKTAIME